MGGCILFVLLLHHLHNLYLFLSSELVCFHKGAVERVADLETDGHRGVAAPCQTVGLVLLQEQLADILNRIGVGLFCQQGVDTAVVVGSLIPAVGSRQVVVRHNTPLRCLAECCLPEGLEHVGSIFLLPHTL